LPEGTKAGGRKETEDYLALIAKELKGGEGGKKDLLEVSRLEIGAGGKSARERSRRNLTIQISEWGQHLGRES